MVVFSSMFEFDGCEICTVMIWPNHGNHGNHAHVSIPGPRLNARVSVAPCIIGIR